MSEENEQTNEEEVKAVAPVADAPAKEEAPAKEAPVAEAAEEAPVKKEETAEDLLKSDLEGVKIRRAKGSKNITVGVVNVLATFNNTKVCLLYTSDAADE